ncbi:SDR family oxidoreductase [Oceanobacillus jeddahense]|uniref:SDR family oxidoreductase n=1 Tax=Oceanobacillus jeddahense TaxID=1462527 RepID=UPI000595EDF5|nr:SDR family oxidoreductase [Oceanobacillus jeddahense]
MNKKIAVITGAGSGLGTSLAIKFNKLNYHVCLIGRNKNKLIQTSELLNQDFSIHTLDISDEQNVKSTFDYISNEFGPIDTLINNAGIGFFDTLEQLPSHGIEQMLDVNLKGSIYCTQSVLKNMKNRDSGTIINIISTAGLEGKVNETVYCASKFGLRGFTEALEVELKETNIRIYAAYMGGMKTNFWDKYYRSDEINHMMNPDDVADIIINDYQLRDNLKVTQTVIKNSK